MKFLIQTINNKVVHDFSLTLIESLKYYEWLGEKHDYILSESIDIPNMIPIGSVEFVVSYIEKYYNKTPKPLNIPLELMDIRFTGRKVINGTNNNISSKMFVKSNDKIKYFTEITDTAPVGNYQISEIVDFQSEYRCFIYKNELVGVKHYCGDFTLFPDIIKIREMIKKYVTSPISYTLDVGISNDDTLIIECHDFFSCGLYGFNDYTVLPYMFSRWFYEFTSNKN